MKTTDTPLVFLMCLYRDSGRSEKLPNLVNWSHIEVRMHQNPKHNGQHCSIGHKPFEWNWIQEGFDIQPER